MSFVCMESIVEVILIIVRYRVGRGGVNMDVLQGNKGEALQRLEGEVT